MSGRWYQSDATAFTAKPPPLESDLYWRVGAWDKFVFPNAWDQSTPQTQTEVKAGDSLLEGVEDAPDETNAKSLSVPVTLEGYNEPRLLSPGSPATVTIPATLATTPEGQFVGVARSDQTSYTVTALIWKVGTDALNAARLREASVDYPQDIKDRYTTGWEQSLPVGGAAMALRDEIWSSLQSQTPYDFAKAIETRLRNTDEFQYDANVVDLPCNSVGLVECFAAAKRGYCMHYATAMVMMLRSKDIPARLAQGFLPGKLDLGTGIETVTMSNAHAWVEVFFPGYGWQPFDPTGGAQGSEPLSGALPVGVPSGSATPKPSSSIKDSDTPRPSIEEPDDADQNLGGVITRPGNPTMLDPDGAAADARRGGLAAIVWWRGPRGEVTPDSAWGTIGRLAARFGFGPRPTQTVYEYASTWAPSCPSRKRTWRRSRGRRSSRVRPQAPVERTAAGSARGESPPARQPAAARPPPAIPRRPGHPPQPLILARSAPAIRPGLARARPTARGLPRPPPPARRGAARDVPWSCGASGPAVHRGAR